MGVEGAASPAATMSSSELDPLIHDPGRLRVAATLAALPAGGALSVTRLHHMLRLPPGRLSTRLRELDRAGYLQTGTTGRNTAQTTVALTRPGRAALDRLSKILGPSAVASARMATTALFGPTPSSPRLRVRCSTRRIGGRRIGDPPWSERVLLPSALMT